MGEPHIGRMYLSAKVDSKQALYQSACHATMLLTAISAKANSVQNNQEQPPHEAIKSDATVN
jgi:hypothetical protein